MVTKAQPRPAKKFVPKKAVKPKKVAVPKPLTGLQLLDNLGIDAICARITAGESQQSIVDSLGISKVRLAEWLAADPNRSARTREARAASAAYWDERAEIEIEKLTDDSKAGSIAKRRELASHYRWRASKYAPKDYGDKLDLNHSGKIDLTDDQVTARLTLLLGKVLPVG